MISVFVPVLMRHKLESKKAPTCCICSCPARGSGKLLLRSFGLLRLKGPQVTLVGHGGYQFTDHRLKTSQKTTCRLCCECTSAEAELLFQSMISVFVLVPMRYGVEF